MSQSYNVQEFETDIVIKKVFNNTFKDGTPYQTIITGKGEKFQVTDRYMKKDCVFEIGVRYSIIYRKSSSKAGNEYNNIVMASKANDQQ